jgi:hypothetical protein
MFHLILLYYPYYFGHVKNIPDSLYSLRGLVALKAFPTRGWCRAYKIGPIAPTRAAQFNSARRRPMLILLLVILLLMSVGSLPTWGHSKNWGYYPSGGLGLVVVILVVLLLLGRI